MLDISLHHSFLKFEKEKAASGGRTEERSGAGLWAYA